MEQHELHKIVKSKSSKRVVSPKQTGFSSPATHYSEPRIDLNDVLVKNSSASFFIRVTDDQFGEFKIFKNDVLIVDKSLVPIKNQLALVIDNGEFKVLNFDSAEINNAQLWGVITYIIKSVL
ncbi:MAG: S24 family peptidase [Psychroserpens sp.]|uniref:S24 family peptidase n=1 Tax=Psychroserpens sp. TaxID=2020870 RepID=UPI003C7246C9